jgi:hypothetical protein
MAVPNIAYIILRVGCIWLERALKYGSCLPLQSNVFKWRVNINGKQSYSRYIEALKSQF